MAFIQHHPNPTSRPDERAGVVERVDIIAIPGLFHENTSSFQTTNGRQWLRDFLPDAVPNSRVLQYQYDTSTAFCPKATIRSLGAFAQEFLSAISSTRVTDPCRPIIFIAYSLGGLLLKAALHQALTLPKFARILKSTYGILLFGTPPYLRPLLDHTLQSLIQNISQKLLFSYSKDSAQVQHLDRSKPYAEHTPESLDLCHNLRNVTRPSCPQTSVFVFYDSSVRHDPQPEVPKWDCKREPNIFLSTSHKDLCRFSSKNDPNYRIVKDRLLHILEKAMHYEPHRTQIRYFDMNFLQKLYTPQNDLRKDRVVEPYPGTCKWILSHSSFVRWRETSNPGILWIRGKPGSGKSVLSRYLLDHLNNPRSDTDPSLAIEESTGLPVQYFQKQVSSVAYFFCDFASPLTGVHEILKSLLHQLLSNRPSLLLDIDPSEKINCSGPSAEPLQLGKLLTHVAKQRKTFLIIDALDEVEASIREDLLSVFSAFYERDNGVNSETSSRHSASSIQSSTGYFKHDIKILVTSRTERPIYFCDSIRHSSISSIDLSLSEAAVNVAGDLRLFVDNYIVKFYRQGSLKRTRGIELRESLVSRASGAFLWVSLAIKLLNANSRFSFIEFPASLKELYAHLLDSVIGKSPGHISQTVLLLEWILHARRPLSIRELEHAVLSTRSVRAIRIDRKVASQSAFDFETSFQRLCGSFVTANDSGIYFIHQSAKDFLLDSEFFQSNRQSWECACIAQSCITYLLDSSDYVNTDNKSLAKSPFHDSYESKSPFLDYAAMYWFDHIKSTSKINKTLAREIQVLKDPSSVPFQVWFRIFWMKNAERWEHKRFPRYVTKLVALAFLGDLESLNNQLKYFQVDEPTSAGEDWTPLMAASWIGHDAVVDLLCEHHAGAFAGPRRNCLTLSYAIQRGHINIAKKLIIHFLRIESDSRSGLRLISPSDNPGAFTPLGSAIFYGIPEIMDCLLDVGANPCQAPIQPTNYLNVGDIDEVFSTPLSLAIFRGYSPRTIRGLLDAGAPGNDLDALKVASRYGSLSALETILEGADSRIIFEYNGDELLRSAARSANPATVELLLKSGASLDTDNSSSPSPLLLASAFGKDTVLSAFLQAQPESYSHLSHLLLASVRCRNLGTTKVLLDASGISASDIDTAMLELFSDVNEDEPTLGHLNAHEDMRLKIIELLLDQGAHVNLRDEYGNTLLHIAADRREARICSLLLHHPCDINAKNIYAQTALSIAAYHGDVHLLHILEDYGAEFEQNTLDNALQSVNHEAIRMIYLVYKQKLQSASRHLPKIFDPLSGSQNSFFHGKSIRRFSGTVESLLSYEIGNLQDILVTTEDGFSFLNNFKSWFEDFSGYEWCWWPMQPRLRTLERGQAWLKWKCNEGFMHRERISSSLAIEIKELQDLYQFLLKLETPEEFTGVTLDPNIRHISLDLNLLSSSLSDWGDGTIPLCRTKPQPVSQSRSQPKQPTSYPSQLLSTYHPNGIPSTPFYALPSQSRCQKRQKRPKRQYDLQNRVQHLSQLRYVLLKVGKEVNVDGLIHIDTSDCTTDSIFFKKLRVSYKAKRGWLKQLFSIWRFSHCNFDCLIRSRNNMITSQSSGKPSADDNFLPEPPEDQRYEYLKVSDHPPISQIEFRRWFYACAFKCFWPKWSHCCDSPRQVWSSGPPKTQVKSSNEALQRIPKIIGRWEVCEEYRGRAFCITAFEEPYIVGLLAYILLSGAGGVVFWCLWLAEQWKADLQDASIGILAIAAMWSIVLAVKSSLK